MKKIWKKNQETNEEEVKMTPEEIEARRKERREKAGEALKKIGVGLVVTIFGGIGAILVLSKLPPVEDDISEEEDNSSNSPDQTENSDEKSEEE